MAQFSIWLCFLLLLGGCGDQEKPNATKILQDMASAEATTNQNSMRLGWNEKIDSRRFGLQSNKNVDGKTLAQIISSQTPGRDDAMLCSACHHSTDAQGGYGVQAAKNAASLNLKPTDMVSNRTWVGSDGWGERFVKNSTKPDNLKLFIQAWIDNGYK